MRILSIIALGVALLIGGVVSATITSANTSDFNPVRSLTTWYTDRTPIDIEVVSSPNPTTGADNFDVKRTLRFHLERAFVHDLIMREVTIVRFGFDMDTGLPDALITAISDRGRFHEDIPGVPTVPFAERLERTMVIVLHSDFSAVSLQRMSAKLQKCAGEPVEPTLLAFRVTNDGVWMRSVYPDGTNHIARYDDDLLLQIACHEAWFRGIGCSMNFPFEGFAAEISFHRTHLSHWREIVDRAASFLKSKQYRAG